MLATPVVEMVDSQPIGHGTVQAVSRLQGNGHFFRPGASCMSVSQYPRQPQPMLPRAV